MAIMYVLGSTDTPWGDYGGILVHGMSEHLGRAEGRIQLERTGPFVPPITLPGSDVIVTDAARRALEQTIPDLMWQPVLKARIVRLSWDTWDRSAEEPAEYPPSGEPEAYLLMRPHDQALSDQLGPLWELVPAIIPSIQLEGGRFNRTVHRGQDFVRAGSCGCRFVSARLREALSRHGGEWIEFRPAP